MIATPYPLQWPAGRPRKPAGARLVGRFGKQKLTHHSWSDGRTSTWRGKQELSVADALSRLEDELQKLGAGLSVVSSNLQVRLDGLPRSGQREPEDPAVAVYFDLAGTPHCMPCDTYARVADNLAAIAAHIQATRAIERHGVATVNEMFRGFQALPDPASATRQPWRTVLGFGIHETVRREGLERAYRRQRKDAHPDHGGSDEKFDTVQRAYEQACQEIGS